MKRKIYLVVLLHSWGSLIVPGALPASPKNGPRGSIGFSLWYDDYEKALKAADGDEAKVLHAVETLTEAEEA